MKNFFIFISGAIVGAVLMCVIAYFISYGGNTNNGITFFEQAGECISENELQVIQVVNENAAIAVEYEKEMVPHIDPVTGDVVRKEQRASVSTDLTVLIYNEEGNTYYDSQYISLPEGKCFRQVGTYRYVSNANNVKTIPIVEILDK